MYLITKNYHEINILVFDYIGYFLLSINYISND